MKMHHPPHPGEVLKELYLEPLNLSVTDAALGLDVARKTLSSIINQHAGISPEMALKLAAAFGTTPESWLNLQQQYNLWYAQNHTDVSHVKIFRPSTEHFAGSEV